MATTYLNVADVIEALIRERDEARRLLCRWRESLDRSLTANAKLLQEINEALGIGWTDETPTKYDAPEEGNAL